MALPLIIIGFATLTLGIALLFVGEVPFVAGKRIPAMRARLIGGILVSYLPVALLVRMVIGLIVETQLLGGVLIACVVFALYGMVVFALVFRIVFPKREKRSAKGAVPAGLANVGPFGVVEAPEEPTPPKEASVPARTAKQKPTQPAESDDNPFNFT